MTDAVHMLTDLIGIFFSLMALWLSNKPPTNRFTFGLHRLGKCLISEPFMLLPLYALDALFCQFPFILTVFVLVTAAKWL